METAKASVKKFLSKSGEHDTTIREEVAPAVTHENVTRTQHDKTHTAVDREVHQDHHHTTVQPIHHQETLAEQHHHREAGVEHRTFEHDDKSNLKECLAKERAQYVDKTRQTEGEHTTSTEPIIAGEHKHHHVYETIQPVVQKETIEPHVVHTTVPVHEVHHNASKHHTASTLPAMTMSEFEKQGGSLLGREGREEHFTGEPHLNKNVVDGNAVGGSSSHGLGSSTTHGLGASSTSNTSSGVNRLENDGVNRVESNGKASLLDKLNPRKDANGDGKAGIMT